MVSTYGEAKVCPYDNQNCDAVTEGLTLEGENSLTLIMNDSVNRSYDELSYYWKAWRDATGKLMRNTYLAYITLLNEAAQANGKAFPEIGQDAKIAFPEASFLVSGQLADK
jgi:peptidyl-dipeptidase A